MHIAQLANAFHDYTQLRVAIDSGDWNRANRLAQPIFDRIAPPEERPLLRAFGNAARDGSSAFSAIQARVQQRAFAVCGSERTARDYAAMVALAVSFRMSFYQLLLLQGACGRGDNIIANCTLTAAYNAAMMGCFVEAFQAPLGRIIRAMNQPPPLPEIDMTMPDVTWSEMEQVLPDWPRPQFVDPREVLLDPSRIPGSR